MRALRFPMYFNNNNRPVSWITCKKKWCNFQNNGLSGVFWESPGTNGPEYQHSTVQFVFHQNAHESYPSETGASLLSGKIPHQLTKTRSNNSRKQCLLCAYNEKDKKGNIHIRLIVVGVAMPVVAVAPNQLRAGPATAGGKAN